MAMMFKYGVPQPLYGIPVDPSDNLIALYGMPKTPPTPLMIILSFITSPIVVIASFFVGTILYLLTHKKIFIIIPLILAFLYLVRYLAENVFGIYLLL